MDKYFVIKKNNYGERKRGIVVKGEDNMVIQGVMQDVGRIKKNG